jgi:glycosyltransferase involved in cell wall biosynthesis
MKNIWKKGNVPIAIVLITLNEGHHLRDTLSNLQYWASEVFIVDSYSIDDTVDIAIEFGVNICQRKFRGFGDQWNFALNNLEITSMWTMKLDPDERITEELKKSIEHSIFNDLYDSFIIERHLCFLNKRLPVKQKILRIWKTGSCKFSDVAVNEHPIVSGRSGFIGGALEHYDSPNLHHWTLKQNNYTTLEAEWQFERKSLSANPRLFGNSLERTMWVKKYFWKIPFRYKFLFFYNFIFLGTWKAGKEGYYWSILRTYVYQLWEIKRFELDIHQEKYKIIPNSAGNPDKRIQQY